MPIAASGSTALVVVVAPTVVGVGVPPPAVVIGVFAVLLSPHAAPINATATSATVSFEIDLDRMGPPLGDFVRAMVLRNRYPVVTTSPSRTSGGGLRRSGIRGRMATNFDRSMRIRPARPPGYANMMPIRAPP